MKEIKLRPRIANHDFETKLRAVRRLLAKDRVKVAVYFRGREITHPNIGRDLISRMIEGTADMARVESRHDSDYSFSVILIKDDRRGVDKVVKSLAS